MPSSLRERIFSADRAERVDGETGRMLFVFSLAIIFFHSLAGMFTLEGPGLSTLFADSDPYLYFNRVMLLEEVGWWERRNPRSNAPEGHIQHWTRPTDLLLWIGAKALAPWMGFKEGLVLWGSVLSPLLLMAMAFLLYWAIRPLGEGLSYFAAAVGVVQFNTLQLFQYGEADHHAPIMVLFVVVLGLFIRLILEEGKESLKASLLGGAAGLAIWFNLEAIVFVLLIYGLFGIAWIRGESRVAWYGVLSSCCLSVVLLLGGLLEYGAALWEVRFSDTLGIPLIVAFGAATLFWAGLYGGSRWLRGRGRREVGMRILYSALLIVVVGVVLMVFAPELLSGPYSERTDLYREARLPMLGEHIPPVITERTLSAAVREAFLYFGLFLVALFGYGAQIQVNRRRKREKRALLWSLLLILTVLFFVATTQQRRWGSYLDLLAAIGSSPVLMALFLLGYQKAKSGIQKVLYRPIALTFLAMSPIVLAALAYAVVQLPENYLGRGAEQEGEADRVVLSQGKAGFCDLRPLAKKVEEMGKESQPSISLLPAERGAEWIFRTSLGVMAIGNHRPQTGFELKHKVFNNRDMKRAKRLLRDRGVNWVFVCPERPRRHWIDKRNRNFYTRLLLRDPPKGLVLRLEGAEAGGWLVYEVEKNSLR